ncbi:MAG: PAS domain S-box protein, partial [Gammaproteobacteria bacterium]|nr:PAS domain S-box protein [Gammaproteobacteria bacterium]
MDRDLRDKIRQATESSGIEKSDFVDLLRLVDQHYDRMEATITQSLTAATPIEAIFDSVSEALMSVSDTGAIRICNKVCAHYFGLTKDQIIGSQIEHLLPGARDKSLAEFLGPYMSSPDDTCFEFKGGDVEARRSNGESFVADINVSPLETMGGRIFVISLRDVTERKEADIALRENEERYRALVENAPEAIVVFDVDDNRFVDANENACMLFNLSRARLLAVGPEAISPKMQPDGTPSFGVRRGHIDAALDGRHPIFEWMHKDSKGKQIPCEVRFSRLPAGKRRLIRVSITDITERKRAEGIAFAQNKILEMIASSMPYDRTLRAICRFVERFDDGLYAAIMRLDEGGAKMTLEQAPSMPEPLKLMLDFVPVAENGITCSSAVHHASDSISDDIAKDSGWVPLLKEAEEHGIGAAWSFLLHGAAGRVIGTLDIYLAEPRGPTTDELDKFSRMARLAGIAIKRQLDEDRLRSSEARYRGLFENVVDGVYIASRDGELITANPALVEMLGFDSVEDLKAAGRTTMLYVNPIDRERVFAR